MRRMSLTSSALRSSSGCNACGTTPDVVSVVFTSVRVTAADESQGETDTHSDVDFVREFGGELRGSDKCGGNTGNGCDKGTVPKTPASLTETTGSDIL
jgi:hypothetical protein